MLLSARSGLLPMFGARAAYTWTGATWALAGGRAYNTPTLGSELLTNVEFTTDTTGWSTINGSTITRRDYSSSPAIAPTGGADNYGLEVGNTGNSSAAGRQSLAATVTVGEWYLAGVNLYSPSTNSFTVVASLTLVAPVGRTLSSTVEDAWHRKEQVGRASTTSVDFRMQCSSSNVTDIAHFDAASLKPLTLSTLPATVVGTAGQTVTTKPYAITLGTQAGVISHLDDTANPANFIIAYHDGGTSIRMDKCVDGTYTSLVSATTGFVSDAVIEIRALGSNQFECWYNGSKRGLTQTVSDAGIISNTRYGLFSTYSANLFSDGLTLGGVLIPFGF